MAMEQKIFILADKTLQTVIEQIRDDQWELDADAIPHWGDDKLTLRDVVNRHVYDDLWVPDTLAGMTIEEVGTKYDADLLGSEPKMAFASAVDLATSHVAALDHDDFDRTVHLSYGDFTVRDYLKHITTFRGFRAYTIAEFIGADSQLPDELVDGLWNIVMPELEDWRGMGIFGAAKEIPVGADKQTELLAKTGFLSN